MSAVLVPNRAKFTAEQFHRMGEAGIFAPNARMELVDGEILGMAPIGSRHAWTVEELGRLLRDQLGERAILWSQNPLRLSDMDEVQPDLMLLLPRPDRYRNSLPSPTDVLLVIEVADTTIAFDRDTKATLYARSGIQEAWFLNLRDQRLETYCDPLEGQYRTQHAYGCSDSVVPTCLSGISIRLDELLRES